MGKWRHYTWRTAILAALVGSTLLTAAMLVMAYVHHSGGGDDSDLTWGATPLPPSATELWLERASLFALPFLVVATIAFAVIWLRRRHPE